MFALDWPTQHQGCRKTELRCFVLKIPMELLIVAVKDKVGWDSGVTMMMMKIWF